MAAATGIASVVLAFATRTPRVQKLDDAIEAWTGPRRKLFHLPAVVATQLGEKYGHPVLAAASALALVHLFPGQPWRFVIPMAAASLGGIAAHHLVKFIYRRPRPAVALARHKTEPAFPSGHTTNCTAVLATSAFIFTTMGIVAPMTAAVMLVLMAGCTGLSRVALGWHWASDVLGGWLTGSCIAALASLLFLALR